MRVLFFFKFLFLSSSFCCSANLQHASSRHLAALLPALLLQLPESGQSLERRAAEAVNPAFRREDMQIECGQLVSEGCWHVSQQPPGQGQEADWTRPELFNA